MKNIYLCALAVLLFMAAGGCGQNKSAATNKSVKTGSHLHDHKGCEGNHEHDHNAGHSHTDGHLHSENDSCGHSHEAGHSHAHNHLAEAPHAHGEECNGSHGHSGHSHQEAEEADPNEIVFTPEQAARTDFEVQPARRGTFRSVIPAGGEIKAAQSQIAIITAPISGVITYMDPALAANADIRANQQLFRLSSKGLASGDAVAKAHINYNRAKAEFQRIEKLYAERLATQSDYLAAQAAYLTAKAEYEPLGGSDMEEGTAIKSPGAGYVSQLNVSMGDYVEMGQPLATVARQGRMQLQAFVSLRYYEELRGVADAYFRMPSSERYYSVSEMGGRPYSVGKAVSRGSSLVPVLFEFDSQGAFPDGAVVEVNLLGGERTDVLTLPISAITEQEGLRYVYVQLDQECYVRRQVELGSNDGRRVEILKGLSDGERVVVRGAVNVKMAANSGAIPHGHSH